jgi:hypothetical protein
MSLLRRIAILFILVAPFYYLPLAWQYNPQSPEFTTYRAGKDAATLALAGAVAFVLLVRRRVPTMRPAPLAFLVLLHSAALVVASVRVDGPYPLDLMFAVRTLLPLSMFVVGQYLFRSVEAGRTALGVLVLGGLLLAGVALFEWVFRPEASIYTRAAGGQFRAVGALVNPLSLGWYLAFVSALVAGGWAVGRRSTEAGSLWWSRGYAVPLVQLGLFAGILASGTRSAMVAAVLFLACAVCLRWLGHLESKLVTRNGLARFAAAALAGGLLSLTAAGLLANGFIETGTQQPLRLLRGVETTRWQIYTELLEEVSRRPAHEVAFGVASETLRVLDERRLNTDSYVFLLLSHGGIFAFGSWALIVVVTVLVGIGARPEANATGGAIAFGVGALAVMSLIGNVLYLFPHGAVFWFVIGSTATLVPRRAWPR